MTTSAVSYGASFASGITYSGRILKGDTGLDSGVVRFYIWIQSQGGCDLYAEQRDVDMTGSGGTYAFEIGNNPLAYDYPHNAFNVKTLDDVFDNSKVAADLDVSKPGCFTFGPAKDEGRVMKVQFLAPGEAVVQALPSLSLTAVPTARQAFNANRVNGYGTGDLLKVDPTVVKTTYANGPLTQAQYDEFWKLILGTSTTYLKAIPTLGGDVTGTLPAMTVVKIQNVAVTAPVTGDTGKVLTYNGTGMVWTTPSAGGITNLNGLTGATQSFVSGTTPLTISSSGSAHTFNISNASSSSSGLLTQTDWNTFNSKQSSALGSGQVWIGNASGGAQAQTLSGDATVNNSGVVTVDKTQSAQASKILQLDSSGNAYVAGVDIKGSSATAKLRFTGSTDMVMNLPTTSGTANQFLQTDGAGNLSWGSQSAMLPTISAGQVWVGNASNGAQAFSLTGDIASVSSTGVVTLSSSATGSNKLPLAGGTMSGAINMGGQNISNAGDVSLAAGKFLGLGVGSTAGTVTGQMWYDSGIIKYFDGTSVQSLGVAGAGITSLNGLTSGAQSFVNGTSGTAPAFSSAGSAHTLNIPMASSTSVTAGLVSNADYASMMAKQSNALPSTQVWVGNASGAAAAVSLSGDVASITNAGVVTVNKTTTGQANYILSLDGTGVANVKGLDVQTGTGKVTLQTAGAFTNYVLTLPSAAPAANQIMKSDASGNLSWVTYLANVSDSAPLTNGKMWIGNASGVASEVTMSGDATITNAGLLTLKNTGTIGTYTKVITDAQGRVTSGSALASGDVTAALGYTPASANAGFINGGNSFAGNATIGLNDAYKLGFKTGGTTRMTLDASGNLGIGTSAPGAVLDVRGPSGGVGGDTLRLSNPSGQTYLYAFSTADTSASLGAWSSSGSQKPLLINEGGTANVGVGNVASPGSLLSVAGNVAVGTYASSAAPTNGLIVSGNVGIGTTSPGVALDVSSKTDAIGLPVGNTSQRPSNATGLLRYNTTTGGVEYNSGSAWNTVGTALGYTPVNKAGDTMSGDLTTQNLNIAAGKYLGLGAGSTAGTVAGQMWYDSGVIKYFDGTSAKSLGVAGAGITSLNGLTANIQSFVVGSAGNAPAITSASSAHTLDIPMASASGSVTAGLISNADYASMMAKQSNALADSFVWVGNSSGAAQARALSGDVTISNVGLVSLKNTGTSGTYFKVVTDAQGRVTSGSALASGDVTAALGYTPTAGGSGYVNGGNSFTGNATIGLNDAYTLGFKTSNATRMTLDASGNLGLGTTTPGRKLHLQYSLNSGDDGIMLENLGNAGANLSLKSSGTGGHEYMLISTGSANSTGAGYFGIYDQSIPAYRMVIGPTGNVGFGTSAPGYTLDLGSRTDALRLPSGLDATRPANAAGLIRYNTTSNVVEYNNGTGWVSLGSSVGNTLAAGQMWVGNASGVAQAFSLSGDVASVSNTGSVVVNKTTTGANNTILSLDGTGVANAYGVGVKGATSGTVTLQAATTTANYSLKLPATTPAANQVMQSDALGNLSWATALTSTTGYVNGGNSFTGNATIGLNDAYTLGFKTNNTTQMTLTSAGRLGIGTATPGSRLDVQGGKVTIGGAGGYLFVDTDTSDSNRSKIAFHSSSQNWTDRYFSGVMYDSSNGYMSVGGGDQLNLDFDSGSTAGYGNHTWQKVSWNGSARVRTEVMRLDYLGRLGIGTNSPSVSLDIGSKTDAIRLPSGTTAQQPTAAAGLIRYNTSNSNIEFNNGSAWTALATGSGAGYVNGGNSFAGNATIGLNDAYNLGIETNNVTRMTFTGNGNIGILTTSPQAALHIADTNATGSSYSPLTIGTNAGAHVGIDFDSVQAYNGGSNSILYLNYWGGDVGLGDASKWKFNRTTTNLEGAGGGGIQISNAGAISTSSGAISSSSGNIYTTTGKIGSGGTPTYSIDAGTNTDALRLPRGTTAQQPANAAGLIRYNTTNSNIEYNNGSGWSVVATSTGATAAYINGGNSYAGNATIGLNDAYTLGVKTNGSTRMTIDASGNVGIGTATPYGPLHIHHATSPYQFYTSTANPNGSVIGADASTFYIYQKENKDFAIGTNNLERMRVLANGNVGIGTISPSTALDVRATTGMINLQATTGTNPAYMTLTNTGNSGGAGPGNVGVESSTGGSIFTGTSPYAFVAGSSNAYPLQLATNNNVRLSISSSGNVGVGTTTPQMLLDVASNAVVRTVGTGQCNEGMSVARTSTADYNWISYHTGTTSGSAPSCGDYDFMVGTNAGGSDYLIAANGMSGSVLFRTDAAMQVKKTNGDVYFGGRVGINTVSPAARFEVKDTTTTTSAIIVPRAATFTGTTANGMVRYNTTTNLFEFYQNGAWVNYTVSSDRRLKTNIEPVTQGLDIVNQLNPVYFDWDQSTERGQAYGTKHQVGFIAQEVEKVLPEVVNKGADTYRTMEYSKMVSVVVAAVKELYQKVVGLDRRVASLEAENQQLKQVNAQKDKELEEMKTRLERIEKRLDSGK